MLQLCVCRDVEHLGVWRALKTLELFSAAPRATLTPLSCSLNFPRAQYLDIRTLTHELIVTDLSFDNIDVAQSLFLFIEISRPHGKNIIGVISYKPPNQKVGDFVSKNNELLQKISREKKMFFNG